MTDADDPGRPPGTMADVTHAHPDHETREWHWFNRGPAVAADGGRRGARDDDPDPEGERDADDEEMRDVSHEPAHGDGADRVWDGTRVRARDPDDDE